MKQHLKEAVNIVWANFGFVLILAVTSMFIFAGGVTNVIVPIAAALNLFILIPAIYGRLAQIVSGESNKPYIEILKDHWINYFVVFLLITLPAVVLFIFMGGPSSLLTYGIRRAIVASGISAMTIYVMPFVFLEYQGVSAIPKGIRYLLGKLKYSILLIILVVTIYVMKQGVILMLYLFAIKNVYLIIGTGFINNILTEFISLVVFVAACKVIGEELNPARG